MNLLSPLRRLKAILLEVLNGKHPDEPHLIYELYANRPSGVMIDVGTHIGTSLQPFAQKGWQIFGFEPDPNNRQKVLDNTSGFNNVNIFDLAVSDQGGKQLEFFTSNVSTGISSLAKFHDSHQPTTVVTTTTLKDVVAEHQIRTIDFLKIDTEGFDLFVLKGFDWNKNSHPKAIVCEFENRKTVPLGYTVDDMFTFLTDKGYQIVISEWYPIVEYGRQHRWRRFISSPQQITNPLAWGNFLAVKPADYPVLVQVCKKIGRVT